MGINDFLVILLTSATVSGIISLLLKTYLDSTINRRIEKEREESKHLYEIEVEKLKHKLNVEFEKIGIELSLKSGLEKEIFERRFQEYPILVELIYRTRNMARDIARYPDSSDSLTSEFNVRANELEDYLYQYRMDLERDELFVGIHNYKNFLKNMSMLLADIKFYKERNDEPRLRDYIDKVHEQYEEIEKSHKPIIESLSSIDEQKNHVKDKTA